MRGPYRPKARGRPRKKLWMRQGQEPGGLGGEARGAAECHQRVDRVVGGLRVGAREQLLREFGKG